MVKKNFDENLVYVNGIEIYSGIIDDVWVMPGDELAGYFIFVPEQALIVK